jgi:secondary thiamine-phosphate synthase enzyme
LLAVFVEQKFNLVHSNQRSKGADDSEHGCLATNTHRRDDALSAETMKRFVLEFPTEGNDQILNLTAEVAAELRGETGDGVVHLFSVGSTCALTTIEYEPGLIQHDLKTALQRLIPDDANYDHEATWNDDNGHSHIRASLIGPSLSVPFSNGKLLTGEYQQIVFIDFDTRPRRRRIIGTIVA